MFCSALPSAPAWTFNSCASALRAARLESRSSNLSRSTTEVRQLPPPPFWLASWLSTACTSTFLSVGCAPALAELEVWVVAPVVGWRGALSPAPVVEDCLLYTSDAADERS